MKYIHSMWSTPATKDNFDNDYDIKYLTKNFYSFMLSALLIKKLGYEIELYCDEKAYEIYSLIPYDKIHVVDFDCDGVSSKFWIYGKIKTHSLINEPYIHIDGDVFFFDDIIGDKLTNNYDLVIQSIENEHTIDVEFDSLYLNSSLPFIENNRFDINWMKYNLNAFNCGVIGFNDIEFKNIYINKVIEILIELSKDVKLSEYREKFNAMFLIAEQSTLYYLTNEYNKKYFEILPYNEVAKNNFRWNDVALKYKYAHLWGYSKYLDENIKKIKNRITKDYPEYIENINKFELCHLQ